MRCIAQAAIIAAIRPYVSRELPGWGRLYRSLAGFRKDYIWQGAKPRLVRNRLTGHITQQDLSLWTDRSTYFLGRWYHLELLSFASSILAPNDIVIDVGANRGEFSLYASSLVPNGQVIAFEPNKECVEILNTDISRNHIGNISVHQFGLSDKDERMTLHVPPYNSGEGTFIPRTSSAITMAAEVKIGDDILKGIKTKLIKIDVEGFEQKVIDGLILTLKRDRPFIVIEMIRSNLERQGSSPEHLAAVLDSLGYSGHQLCLKKSNGHYGHCLKPIDLTVPAYDAVWSPNP